MVCTQMVNEVIEEYYNEGVLKSFDNSGSQAFVLLFIVLV